MNFENDEPFIEKSKHKGLKIFLLILLIVGLIGGAYYYYKNYYNNPVEKVKNVIINLEEKINERLQATINFGNKSYKVNGLLKFNLQSSIDNEKYQAFNKIFNNLVLQINGDVDLKNNIANLDLSSKVNNENLINGNLYMENNKVYVQSSELYDKYIYLCDVEEKSDINLNSLEIANLTKIYNIIVSTIIKNLDTKNAKKKEDITKIDGVNTKVNRYSITFKNDVLINLLKKTTTDLKNNNTFVSIMNIINKEWEKEFDKSFSIPEDYNNTINGNNENIEYTIHFFTTRDIANEKLIKISQSYKIKDATLTMDVDFIDEDTYLITINNGDQDIIIRLTINNTILSATINTEINKAKINISANLNYEEISNVQKQDINDSISIENMSEDDKQIIDENMKKNNTLIDFSHNIRTYLLFDKLQTLTGNN